MLSAATSLLLRNARFLPRSLGENVFRLAETHFWIAKCTAIFAFYALLVHYHFAPSFARIFMTQFRRVRLDKGATGGHFKMTIDRDACEKREKRYVSTVSRSRTSYLRNTSLCIIFPSRCNCCCCCAHIKMPKNMAISVILLGPVPTVLPPFMSAK